MSDKEKEIWRNEMEKLKNELWETVKKQQEIFDNITMIKSLLEEEEIDNNGKERN